MKQRFVGNSQYSSACTCYQGCFAMAADHMPSGKEPAEFFSSIQNRLPYAIAGHGATELMMICSNAEAFNSAV